MKGIIYKYTSPSCKSYIGQTINPDKRIGQHKNSISYKNGKFQDAIKKYGMENLSYTVLVTIEEEEEEFLRIILNRLERMYISKYNSYNIGYNMTKGGRGTRGLIHTLETKEKCSKSNKGRFSGENHPMYGKKHTESTKDLIRSKRMCQWVDEDGKLTSWNKGISMSDEQKKKCSEVKKGKKPNNVIKVDKYSLDGAYMNTYNSLTEAAVSVNGQVSQVSSVCKGKRKTHKGHIFKFNQGSSTIESTLISGSE